jgi:hypothetical protein
MNIFKHFDSHSIFGGSSSVKILEQTSNVNKPEAQVPTEILTMPTLDEDDDEPQYLPGEKLLLSINKKFNSEKRKKSKNNKLDLDKIHKSMSKIISQIDE